MGLAVSFDSGPEQVQPSKDVPGSTGIHDTGAPADQLSFENACEVEPHVPTPETEGVVRADVLPSDLLGVLEHRILNRRPLAHYAFCSSISETESRPLISSSNIALKSSSIRDSSSSRACI